MAQQTINIGAVANDGTGDTLRDGGDKINDNFTELYGAIYTDEKAQDAIGAMIDGSLTYVDATPLLQRSALTGDVTASAGSNATTIANNAVTFAKFVAAASAGVVWASGAGNYSHNASGGGTTNFLRADGTWAAPSGAGTVTSVATAGLATGGPITGTGTVTVTAAAASDVQAGSSTTKAVTPAALGGASAPQTLTDGATITWDMSAGFNAKVTLGGNRTLAVSNPTAGWTYSFNIGQDATGSRTLTWPASFDWGTTGAPTLTTTASKWDRVTIFCTDAATPKFQAFLSGKGFAA